MTNLPPRVFVSYSWTSPEHEEFVLTLATRLRSDGVDVILDKWDLREGHDKHVFMETMVTDPNVWRVLIICDKRYAERADSRAGGVGTESQIISAEVYNRTAQEKFIPVVSELGSDGAPHLPAFLKSRIYIDLSDVQRYYSEYEKLLRNIFEKPLNRKPELGTPPRFAVDDPPKPIATLSIFRALTDAFERDRSSRNAHEAAFLDTMVNDLENFRITRNSNEYDDDIVRSIEDLKPYRDQFVEFIRLKCLYGKPNEDFNETIRFLERVCQHYEPPIAMSTYIEGWFDNYKFFGWELFLYLIASLVRYRRISDAVTFLEERYIITRRTPPSVPYGIFCENLDALDEHRNRRLNLGRGSLSADLLKARADSKQISFDDIMQTDLILSVRGLVGPASALELNWFPRAVIFRSSHIQPFELFLRVESPQHREGLCKLLGIGSIKELVSNVTSLRKAGRLDDYRIGRTWRVPFENLMNFTKLSAL
ncbi:SEFIR domain-containing protein [soil metagenome]